MYKLGLILGNTNTLILKDRSLLRFTRIDDIKKIIRKNFISRPSLLLCTNSISEDTDLKKIKKELKVSKIYCCEKVKAILIGKNMDITKSAALMVINIEDNVNIGIVSLGKVILNKSLDIDDNIVKNIKKELDNLNVEMVNDIRKKGIVLSGNNSLIKDIYNTLRKELDIPILISDNTENDLVDGAKTILNDLSLLY